MSTLQLAPGLLLGLDSFLVCLAVGSLPQGRARRIQLALSFGLCDGFASWIGLMAGMEWLLSRLAWSEWLGPAVFATYGLYILCLAWRWRDPAMIPGNNRWLAFSLPVCLSFDNLLAGMGTQASGVSAVLVAMASGVVTGGLALLGLEAGSAVATCSPFRAQWLSGAFLILVAVASALQLRMVGS
jgi:putative Mn2+ efflux pump MntP